jgi:hypothetical protein
MANRRERRSGNLRGDTFGDGVARLARPAFGTGLRAISAPYACCSELSSEVALALGKGRKFEPSPE